LWSRIRDEGSVIECNRRNVKWTTVMTTWPGPLPFEHKSHGPMQELPRWNMVILNDVWWYSSSSLIMVLTHWKTVRWLNHNDIRIRWINSIVQYAHGQACSTHGAAITRNRTRWAITQIHSKRIRVNCFELTRLHELIKTTQIDSTQLTHSHTTHVVMQ
jgi:hypothetical protein